jgi:hypothetical protein
MGFDPLVRAGRERGRRWVRNETRSVGARWAQTVACKRLPSGWSRAEPLGAKTKSVVAGWRIQGFWLLATAQPMLCIFFATRLARTELTCTPETVLWALHFKPGRLLVVCRK